jgi:hypothetical protein
MAGLVDRVRLGPRAAKLALNTLTGGPIPRQIATQAPIAATPGNWSGTAGDRRSKGVDIFVGVLLHGSCGLRLCFA